MNLYLEGKQCQSPMKISQTFIIVDVNWLLGFSKFIEIIFSKKFQKWFLQCIKYNQSWQTDFLCMMTMMLKKLNLNHNLTNAVLEFDSHCLLIACRVFNVEIIFSPNVESCMFTWWHISECIDKSKSRRQLSGGDSDLSLIQICC